MKIYHGSTEIVSSLINKEILISELKAYRLVDQYLFHTKEALKTLTFIEAKEITL